MDKIFAYSTASGSIAEELDQAVNYLLSQGFQPYGSPYLTDTAKDGAVGWFMMFQAMVQVDPRTTNQPLKEEDFPAYIRQKKISLYFRGWGP